MKSIYLHLTTLTHLARLEIRVFSRLSSGLSRFLCYLSPLMSHPDGRRKLHVSSFGCQMNDYDVARMVEVMKRRGYDATSDEIEADVIVLNSCAIREKAEHKLASAVGRFRPLKQARPHVLLAVGGCVPTLTGADLLDTLPLVDFTFGPDAIPQLPDLVDRALSNRERFASVAFTDIEQYSFLDAAPRSGNVKVTALVTVQKGCDNDCAYCVVPATRGVEVSRPPVEVTDEIARFVAAGAREVTLIGQNVNSYRALPGGFAELLARADHVPGLLRLRFTTSHPKDFNKDVANCFRDLPRLCEWVHLPAQSGSTRVLQAMRRTYSRDEYLRKVEYLRDVCPDISISTDIIVGYPGETDEDFADTLSLLETVQYDEIYSFKYSVRPRTKATELGDTVPEARKAERLERVQELQRGITKRRLSRFVHRTMEILVEGESRGGGQACGRTRNNQPVNFPLPMGEIADYVGKLVHVEIVSARVHSLEGRFSCA